MINNITNETSTEVTKNGFGPGQFVIITFYIIIFIFGLFGNSMIIATITLFRKMKTPFNVYLGNLAIADLTFLIWSLFFLIKYVMNSAWIFGEVFCKLQATFLESSFTASVLTLAAVAIERYMSICFPHRSKRTVKHATKMCGLVWIMSLLVCCPLLYGSKVSINHKGELGCHNNNWSAQGRFVFYLVHTIFLYCIPLVTMCFSHVKIHNELSSRRNRKIHGPKCEDTTNEKGADPLNKKTQIKLLKLESEKNAKIIRLLVIVVVVFIVIWTPYVVGRIIMYAGISISEIIIRSLQVLILSSTGVNFIIYSCVNNEFRRCFKELLTPLTCSKNKPSDDVMLSTNTEEIVISEANT